MHTKVKKTVLTALFAAVISVASFISIPILGVPITLQTFAIPLALFTLGGVSGLVAILVYFCLGLVGLPVFAGFTGGFGALFGPTGGFIIGFLLLGIVYIVACCLFKGKRLGRIIGYSVGHIIMYAVGSVWYYVGFADGASFLAVLLITVLPFVIPDIIKVYLAFLVSKRVRRRI